MFSDTFREVEFRTWENQEKMKGVSIMKVSAYIYSLKNMNNGSNTLGEAEIIKQIGDNLYLAEYNGIKCTAIFNCFTGCYYVDDVYGIQQEQ